jgi:hypothetical protein
MKIPKRKDTPEVISGARGPRSERSTLSDGSQRNPVGDKRPGKIVFQSAFASHRIQVTAPPDIKDPFSGRLTQGRPKTAQFRNNILAVDEKDEDMLAWLRGHPKFNIEFWLLSDVIQAGKDAQRETARQVLADPEQREALLAELKESGDLDFNLPDALPEAKTEAEGV